MVQFAMRCLAGVIGALIGGLVCFFLVAAVMRLSGGSGDAIMPWHMIAAIFGACAGFVVGVTVWEFPETWR